MNESDPSSTAQGRADRGIHGHAGRSRESGSRVPSPNQPEETEDRLNRVERELEEQQSQINGIEETQNEVLDASRENAAYLRRLLEFVDEFEITVTPDHQLQNLLQEESFSMSEENHHEGGDKVAEGMSKRAKLGLAGLGAATAVTGSFFAGRHFGRKGLQKQLEEDHRKAVPHLED